MRKEKRGEEKGGNELGHVDRERQHKMGKAEIWVESKSQNKLFITSWQLSL